MYSDPTTLLEPKIGLMVWTLAALAASAGVCVYFVIRVVRAMRRSRGDSSVTWPLRGEAKLQDQVDALSSQVYELGEANRFLEKLVTDRHAQPIAEPRPDSAR